MITIHQKVWEELWAELKHRGRGIRESGAFLLARHAEPTDIADVVYFDDLDPDCLVGGIHFHADGYSKLWDHCDSTSSTVVADVHTHPGNGIGQSKIDRDNPMIDRIGHVAFIFPNFAIGPENFKRTGVYLHEGPNRWKSLHDRDRDQAIRIVQ
jgi:proteasome lid subunit RPN8/RPN11